VGFFLLTHMALRNAGIDTVGPVHFTELALPVLVLTALGLERGARWLEGLHAPGRRVALAAVTSVVVAGLTLYAPYRLRAVSTIGTLVNVPGSVRDVRGIENAVVFVVRPYAAPCNPALRAPSRPFVLWWPMNDPEFDDDVLFANHLSVEADRRLMSHFPGRAGWIQRWRSDCRLELTPLDEADPDLIPNGNMVRSRMWDETHPLTGELPPGFSPTGEPDA
jgi:hypothetical protein